TSASLGLLPEFMIEAFKRSLHIFKGLGHSRRRTRRNRQNIETHRADITIAKACTPLAFQPVSLHSIPVFT
ncbi:MAG: hypothetical protein Q9M23_03395, partial [Mariprofundaceae bacterium]|nr:hypothetical protein [Mariprofundaceae bacterium]